MDIARQMMGEIDQSYDPNSQEVDSDSELIEIDETSAPSGMRLQEILMDRHWVFEEVLWIKGAAGNLSRQELGAAVADAKGVPEDKVDVCFFDEDELSHATITDTEKLGAAGMPTGDVVSVWATKYKPANFRRYSRKWKKIEARQKKIPKRWYLVTAIRKDGLLDDERDQHLSAEEVHVEEVQLSKEDLEEQNRWLPPSFDYRKVKSLKEQYAKPGTPKVEEKKREPRMTRKSMSPKKLEAQAAVEEAKNEG
ncbi:hypothetical protein TL16_g00278 [Triparma laevis f. inornata]|uniref:Uncharacterized protein n=2 Tax=Triparma laevis TaxID=1534972 RepID=A0A9W7L0E4_9STRA|nr:hypothetical protein TL16_g00278 [Triparma laevis f. inornata]GMI17676.1 hypothetical protein TrLO_g10551 [Triparma laevis f. longispina]